MSRARISSLGAVAIASSSSDSWASRLAPRSIFCSSWTSSSAAFSGGRSSAGRAPDGTDSACFATRCLLGFAAHRGGRAGESPYLTLELAHLPLQRLDLERRLVDVAPCRDAEEPAQDLHHA